MAEELLYKTALEEKISSFVVSDGDIVNYDSRYNEKKKCLEITLNYRDFTVLMYYSKFDLYGYSFLENDNSQNQLVTKFLFSFSKIPYSIYDVHNAVDDRVFDTYDFHCLYNESRLLEAADTVFAFISRNKNLLFSINENETLKNKLEASFDRGLKLASKKITREKISQDPEKYLYNHDVALYLYRTGESTLTDAVNHSKKGQFQRFFAKESKKDRLLTYEERYLEYLYENDFNAADGKVEERVKTQQSVSNRIES